MRLINSFNLAQRVVLVVALGLALHVIARWLLVDDRLAVGWFSYAPHQAPLVSSGRGRFSRELIAIVRLLFVAAWAAVSVWLLADRRRGPAG